MNYREEEDDTSNPDIGVPDKVICLLAGIVLEV